MAMITCPDCNGQLSDSAPTCPHCGRPNTRLDQKSRNVGFILGVGIFLVPLIFSWFTLRKGHTTTARVVSFVWLTLIMMIVLGTDTSKPLQNSSTASARPTTSEFVGSTTAVDVARAYEENTVAADQQFKGRKYVITGTVADINTNFMGDPYVTLKGGVNMFMEPQFAFPKSASAQLAALSKGAQVSILCRGLGDVAKTPMWDSCSLQ